MTNPSINLTAIFVKDSESKGFTGFFAQFPNIVAEGETEDETMKNLISLVTVVFEHQRNQEMKTFENRGSSKEITTRSVQAVLS